MKEMLIVGRGGQGVVLASQILADTFARAGYWVQSFPEFKAERRGAPISAFFRWDETRRSTAGTRCASATCSSRSRRRRRRRRCSRACGRAGSSSLNRECALPVRRRLRDRARARLADRRRHGDPLLGREADGQHRRAGRVRPAAAAGRAGAPRAGDRGPHGRARRGRTSPPRETATRAARPAHAPGDAPVEQRRRRRRAAPHAALPGQHDRLARQPHRLVVARSGRCSSRRAPPARCARCSAPRARSRATDGAMAIDYLYCKGCGICEVVCPVRNAIAMEEVRA